MVAVDGVEGGEPQLGIATVVAHIRLVERGELVVAIAADSHGSPSSVVA